MLIGIGIGIEIFISICFIEMKFLNILTSYTQHTCS